MARRRSKHGFATMPSYRRTAWKPILCKMGPDWHPIKKRINSRTIRAMQAEGVAAFIRQLGVLFGRLTPAGVALRDAWLSRDAVALDKQQGVGRDRRGVVPKRHSGRG
jgi:hypothetical protein